MDIVTYVLAKKAGGSAEEAKKLAEQALRETAALDERLTADEEIIDSIKNGLQYKGAVDYYKDLPANYTEAEVGYCYTVKYKGESGTQPSGKEYVWGSSDGTLQWIELGGLLEDYIKSITYDAETNSLEITDQDNNVITFSAATHQEVIDEADRAQQAESDLSDLIRAEAQRAKDAEDALDAKIEAETTRAEGKEAELEIAIGNEATVRANADTALGQRIDDAEQAVANEQLRAEGAESALGGRIDDEITRATTAEETLQGNIDTEEAARIQAVSDEADRATQAEQSLGGRIDAAEGLIADEATARENADITLQGNIDDEVLRAQTAEGGLSDRITAIENDYLTSADKTELQGAIDDEATARAEAIAQEVIDRDAAIAVETENREAADTALGGRIDDAEIAIGSEETRATTAEGALSDRLDTIEGEIQEGTTSENPLVNKEYVDTAIEDLPEPMIFKGSVGEGGTVEWDNLPEASAANEGFTYKVITKHTTAPICEVDDTIISNGIEWVVIPSGDEPSGTVTSVDVSVPTGLTATGGPITSSGVIAINLDTGYTIPTEARLSSMESDIDNIEQDITNIKDGQNIDSFGDVEAALDTKQDTINEDNKLNSDYIDEYTTEDDIQSLFPEKVETIEAFETALTSADKYLELEADMTKAKTFDIAGVQKTIDLNGNTIESTDSNALRLNQGAELVIEGDGNVNSQEFGVLALHGSSATINGGTFTTTDNVVLGTNGLSGYGENTIVVNDGTFNAHITSNGYIACGVYVANNDTVVLNGGTFNIYDGCGVCVRSGQAIIGENVVFNMLTEHIPALTAGKVGDSPIQVPAGERFVLDLKANYPGGKPSIVLNGILYDENNIEAAREAGITVLEA